MYCFIFLDYCLLLFFFFFQAEDGIRDLYVTGVQTCALPISFASALPNWPAGLWWRRMEEPMSHSSYRTALIVGAGSGLSASIARVFANANMTVALAARGIEDLAPLAAETGAKLFACDATDRDQVMKLFADVSAAIGAPEAVVYNASHRVRAPI